MMPTTSDATEVFIGGYAIGVCVAKVASDGSGWTLGAPDPAFQNASYATFNASSGIYYILDEQAGLIHSASRTADGMWRKLASFESGGGAPCHLDLDAYGKALAVANYESGSVSLFRVEPRDGSLVPIFFYQNHGRGANAERQASPHAHCVRFHGTRLYCTDLGTDEVLSFAYDPDAVRFGDTTVVWRAPPGQGPRHIMFHPTMPIAYVLTEMGSTVFVLQVADNALSTIQHIATLPENNARDSTGAHLEMDAAGTRLYASNRGHDSIAVFEIDGSGMLKLSQVASTHRASPRHFLILRAERQILVAHEKDGLVAMRFNADGSIGEPLDIHDVAKAAFVGVLSSSR